LNFCLVSNKNCNAILPSSRLGLGPDEVGQKAYNYPTYDATHKRSKTLKLLLFFSFRHKDLPSLVRFWTPL